MHPNGLFGPDDHPGQPGRHGDPLEVPERTVDFEHFRGWLVDGPGYGNGSRGGRAPFGPVSMFRALILQAQHNPSDARMQLMIRDRLSWMRFPDLEPGGPTPDGNATRHFRNRLTGTGRLRRVMKAIDRQLRKKGCIPMSGRTVGASLVPAPGQRSNEDEKAAVKAGRSAKGIWPNEPDRAAQEDVDARWTLKNGGRVRYRPDGTPLPMIAIPTLGYRSHISIDRRSGLIGEATVTSATQADGRQPRHVVGKGNTAPDVWADSACRSSSKGKWPAGQMLTSRIHRRKPKGKPMSQVTGRANAGKSSVRARIGHVSGHQKNRSGPFIRTIGLARAEAKLIPADLACNLDRLIFHERRRAMG